MPSLLMSDSSPDALPVLAASEVRVLGALFEKALSTPDAYPLTVNALVAACNQKSNREPVVAYDAPEVEAALARLIGRRLAAEQTGMGMRVAKYRALAGGVYDLTSADKAVLAELMLRGPQTASELRARCARMHTFATPADVEAVVERLATRQAPLVAELPGRREPRWAHRLAGEPDPDADDAPIAPSSTTSVGALSDDVEALRARIEALETAFEAFRQQFE